MHSHWCWRFDDQTSRIGSPICGFGGWMLALVVRIAALAIGLLVAIVGIGSWNGSFGHLHQLPHPPGQWPSCQMGGRKATACFCKMFYQVLKGKTFYKFDHILYANKYLKMKKKQFSENILLQNKWSVKKVNLLVNWYLMELCALYIPHVNKTLGSKKK